MRYLRKRKSQILKGLLLYGEPYFWILIIVKRAFSKPGTCGCPSRRHVRISQRVMRREYPQFLHRYYLQSSYSAHPRPRTELLSPWKFLHTHWWCELLLGKDPSFSPKPLQWAEPNCFIKPLLHQDMLVFSEWLSAIRLTQANLLMLAGLTGPSLRMWVGNHGTACLLLWAQSKKHADNPFNSNIS